ncbi:restriction endonuclease subunit S [Acinetobacter sp. YH16052]|uniref:restriction endonuclease subunit S n=1 Tax=Acinetobacter sp. YH16052 TaxID=2601191 RepID=UPI00211F024D|nr:restriction endonuclease subunit S [Acinetobacter sp. YH16052]
MFMQQSPLIAKQEKLIELLKEKHQAVISHAVTKGLNPDVAMKDSGVEWLGQVPEHWKIPKLKQLIRYGSSISYGIVQPGDALNEGVPFIQTTNISKGSFKLEDFQKTSVSIESNYPRSRLQGGEVILGIRASIGAAFVVPMSFKGVNLSRGIARIVPNNLLRADFLVWYFKSNAVDQYWGLSKQGSTFSEVSIETVKELNVVIPPLVEQADIAKYLTNESNKFEKLINSAETQKILLQERRTALISSAVTGKINVSNWQHPNEAKTELSL